MNIQDLLNRIDTTMIEKITLIGSFILPIFTGIYFSANYMYNYRFKQLNEAYYGIPSKYFQSSINDKIFQTIMIIILLGFILSSLILKTFLASRSNIIDKVLMIYLSVSMGFVFSWLVIQSVFTIIKNKQKNSIIIWVENNILLTGIVIIVLSIIVIMYMTYTNEIESKIGSSKNKYLYIPISVVFAIFIYIVVNGIGARFSYKPKNKTIYETIVYEDNNMVVLADFDDKVLVTEYKTNENKEVIFNTYNYMVINKENLVMSYKNLGKNIIIKKEE